MSGTDWWNKANIAERNAAIQLFSLRLDSLSSIDPLRTASSHHVARASHRLSETLDDTGAAFLPFPAGAHLRLAWKAFLRHLSRKDMDTIHSIARLTAATSPYQPLIRRLTPTLSRMHHDAVVSGTANEPRSFRITLKGREVALTPAKAGSPELLRSALLRDRVRDVPGIQHIIGISLPEGVLLAEPADGQVLSAMALSELSRLSTTQAHENLIRTVSALAARGCSIPTDARDVLVNDSGFVFVSLDGSSPGTTLPEQLLGMYRQLRNPYSRTLSPYSPELIRRDAASQWTHVATTFLGAVRSVCGTRMEKSITAVLARTHELPPNLSRTTPEKPYPVQGTSMNLRGAALS